MDDRIKKLYQMKELISCVIVITVFSIAGEIFMIRPDRKNIYLAPALLSLITTFILMCIIRYRYGKRIDEYDIKGSKIDSILCVAYMASIVLSLILEIVAIVILHRPY